MRVLSFALLFIGSMAHGSSREVLIKKWIAECKAEYPAGAEMQDGCLQIKIANYERVERFKRGEEDPYLKQAEFMQRVIEDTKARSAESREDNSENTGRSNTELRECRKWILKCEVIEKVDSNIYLIGGKECGVKALFITDKAFKIGDLVIAKSVKIFNFIDKSGKSFGAMEECSEPEQTGKQTIEHVKGEQVLRQNVTTGNGVSKKDDPLHTDCTTAQAHEDQCK